MEIMKGEVYAKTVNIIQRESIVINARKGSIGHMESNGTRQMCADVVIVIGQILQAIAKKELDGVSANQNIKHQTVCHVHLVISVTQIAGHVNVI